MTLRDLHDAIIQALSTQFSSRVEYVGLYRPAPTDPINTPAILLEMEGASDTAGPGDGRIPLRCRFTVHCLLSFRTTDVEIEIRDFAAEVYRLVRKNIWGLGRDVKIPEQIEMGPGQFQPGKGGYESWYVTWDQTCFFEGP